MRRLTVLGSCGAWPEPNRACSGFLVDHEGFRVVLDLGFGTLPRLLAECPDGAVDAVIVTHEHSDHCVDLNGLFRVRYFDRARRGRLPLYCPPEVITRVDQLEPTGDLEDVFEIRELPATDDIGPFRLESVELPHFVRNVGVRLVADGFTLAYSGDTGPDEALGVLGRGADLLVIEASHPGDPPDRQPRYHLRAREAGEWAARAGAKRVMLTHFWPGSDRQRFVAEASERFEGTVIAAEEGLTVDLG